MVISRLCPNQTGNQNLETQIEGTLIWLSDSGPLVVYAELLPLDHAILTSLSLSVCRKENGALDPNQIMMP